MMRVMNFFMFVIAATFISTIALNSAVFFYVVAHDEVFYELYNVSATLDDKGIMHDGFLEDIESAIEGSDFIIPALDMVWLAAFLSMVISIWIGSYTAKREGYFSVLGMLTIGMMILMFVTSVFIELSQWFKNLIINEVLLGYEFSAPFYTFYIDNAGVVSMIIILVAIALNFIDFDFSKFTARKEKEKEEIN